MEKKEKTENLNSNMKQCKSCNKEIAKSAKTCPNCGAINKKPFYKLKRTYVILIVLFMFVGIAGGSEDEPTPTNTIDNSSKENKDVVSEETSSTEVETEEQIEYTKYEVSQLVDDLNNNALAASEKYKNQYVELTGKLSVIDSSGEYISISPSNNDFSFTTVQCYIKTDEQKSIVSTLSKGDEIIVKGKIKSVGEILGYYLDIDEIQKN